MSAPTSGQPQVWFLTGSQGLYGPEVLAQVEADSRAIARQLDQARLPVQVVWRETLTDKAAIRRTMLEADADDAVVGVIAWMHTFSPAKMWIAGLDTLDKPLLHLHTQAEAQLPWATIDMDFMNLHQSAHGDREFAALATRLGLSRATVMGHVGQLEVVAQIDCWARAAIGWQDTRRLNLVRFGDNMRDVAVTEGDKVEAEHVFGVTVNSQAVHDLALAVAQVGESEAEDLTVQYQDLYQVAPELGAGGERHAALVYAARQEIALRHFLEDCQAKAFTTNFEDLGALEQLPGLAVQRLTADGYGFGAEGDWKTAVLVRAAKVMGDGLKGGASLMEDYTYNLVPGRERVLGAHMLEVCPSLTASRPRLEIHPLSIGNRHDPVRLVFEADPGPGLVVSLTDLGERFRLTANTVQLVAADGPMPRLPVGRAVWRPDPDLATSAACWLEAGGAHHTVMTTAATAEHFAGFAAMAGVEWVLIDAATTRRGFAQELRWNAAYYRLKRGL
ncbi:MAG: L-arabinose isomerase [Propionibacteriaceae bacterium]|jgi:L-arabinose isomerase|nr:L-arabinose isomerase [Propionibacteriaceae bacterium]